MGTVGANRVRYYERNLGWKPFPLRLPVGAYRGLLLDTGHQS